jgi:hypothetical protein
MKKHRYENGNPPQSINDWRYHIVKDGMPMNVHQCLEELNRLQEQVQSLLCGNMTTTPPINTRDWS